MLLSALAAATLSAGCIVPEAPEYGAPRQSPVFVEADSIFPNPQTLQHYETGTGQLEFRFNIRAEDAGAQLISVLYIDYKHKDGRYIDHKNIKPQSFDAERLISWTHTLGDGSIDPKPGCHNFTVTVFHESPTSWDAENNKQLGTPPDMAAVTWFASFNDDGTSLLSLCPDASTEVSSP